MNGSAAGTMAEPRAGDVVAVGERRATFLYRRGLGAAVVRFQGESDTRVVPFAKVRTLAS